MASMKRIKSVTLILVSFLLASCGVSISPSSSSSLPDEGSSSSTTESGQSITSSSADESESITSESSEESTPYESSSSESSENSSEEETESSVPEETSSSTESSSSEILNKDGVYHFYCVNDFHGAVVEQMNGSYYEVGISKYFGELRKLKEEDPDHTILLSAGDMFQGSLESNSNYGMLVTEAMNEAGFEAMTIGNHEFDYGPKRLLDIIDKAEFPVLGGNIMKYDNGPTNEIWNPSIKTSTIIQKGNAKIGVVGMIGEGQTTSISSQHVQDITFVAHEQLAKTEATRLRNEEGCDIVILVVHDNFGNSSYAANRMYFDGVFNGHTHRREVYYRNNVPCVQSVCDGEAYSYFDITISNNSTSCTSYGVEYAEEDFYDDEYIASIRDKYILDEDFVAKASSYAGKVNGTLGAKEGVSNLCCKAIYEEYIDDYPNLACTMMNGQRAQLSGDITYRDIVKATPFTNHIVFASVKGADILAEAEYNLSYTGDEEKYRYLDPDAYYDVGVIDYVLYHQNVNKVYDYFPSLNDFGGGKIYAEYERYPFNLAFEYIKENLHGEVNASFFKSGSNGFSIYA